MSATTPQRDNTPPDVDLNDPRDWSSILLGELRPTPGRLSNTLRLLLVALLSIAIGEFFRMPEVALLAYFAFIVGNNDSGSTVRFSLLAGGMLVVGTFCSILIFMLSLSQPALRIPLMGCLIFATAFLTKASAAGQLFYAVGMWTVYQLPNGDELIVSAAQTPYVSGNTTSASIPDIALMSPEESLLHSQLWSAADILVALTIVVIANLLWRRDPALIVRQAVADRLGAAAALCKGIPDAAERLSSLTWQGTSRLLKLNGMAAWLKSDAIPGVDAEMLIRAVDRLCLVLLAGSRVLENNRSSTLIQVGEMCHGFERQVRGAKPSKAYLGSPPEIAETSKITTELLPLVPLLQESLRSLRAILGGEQPATATPEPAAKAGGLLVADVWSNPDYVHHALKLTLAAMGCYLIERATNWPGIHTCLITCFIVALDTNGASVRKMLLRVGGCIIGAALGIGVIQFLMPLMTDLGDLLLVSTPPLLLAAWIKSGGERSSYIGQQMAIGYYSCVLSGFGPTTDMEGGRDRTIGILLGNVLTYLVYSSIWPVPVAGKVRAGIADALLTLGQMVGTAEGRKTAALRKSFDKAIETTQSLLSDDPYDPASLEGRQRRDPSPRRTIDMSLIRGIQQLVVPVLVLRSERAWDRQDHEADDGGRRTVAGYRDAMEEWFAHVAAYVRSGRAEGTLGNSLPAPPEAGPEPSDEATPAFLADAAWCDMLHHDISTLLDTVAPASREE